MKYLLAIVTMAIFPAAAWAEDAHELMLNIPAAGKIKVSIEKTERRTDTAGTSTFTVSYDILNSYVCENDVCTVQSQVPAVTLKSFNGQVPPLGADTFAVTGMSRIMDGVSWTADRSFLPAKIIGREAFKANYIKAMTAKIGLVVDAAKIKSPEFQAEMTAAADRKFSGAGVEVTALEVAPEHALLSWPHNATLSVGQANSDTLSFISPINGGPVESDLTMTLLSWDAVKNTAVITFSERPKLAGMAAHVARPDTKDLTLHNDKDCRYEVDTVTGLVRKGECTVVRGISTGGVSRLTELHFVMSEALVE